MKHHWIRDDIEISFPLPKFVQELVRELEALDEVGDYAYEGCADALDVGIKEAVRRGEMTQKQWDLLSAKYIEVM